MYLIGEGPSKRPDKIHRRGSDKEGLSEKVRSRRSAREELTEKIRWRRSNGEDLTEKIQQRRSDIKDLMERSDGEGPLEKVNRRIWFTPEPSMTLIPCEMRE